MAYNFSVLDNGIKEVEVWLQKELSSVRTGRATPALLDGVLVESYGIKTPLVHVAAISIEDPRTLRITPWDPTLIKSIESAISAANLGVSTTPDNKSTRVIFPELTSERRIILLKHAGEKQEEAKIRLRGEREKVWNDIQAKEKEGVLTEDEKFRHKDELQKKIDAAALDLQKIFEKKKSEIEA